VLFLYSHITNGRENFVLTGNTHLMIAKTTSARVDDAVDAIKAMHSYDMPEIIAVPVRAGYSPYLDWVRRETGRHS
jgi:periplasmic divalent cation tolerance protein